MPAQVLAVRRGSRPVNRCRCDYSTGPPFHDDRTFIVNLYSWIFLQLGDDRGQCLSFDVLHGVIVDAMLTADAEDRHNVGMVEGGGGLGFIFETLHLSGIESGRKWQNF